MHFSTRFLAALLLVLAVTVFAQNATTTKAPTTTATPVISCKRNSQCPKTSFCQQKQRICVAKYQSNSTCNFDGECQTDKCQERVCRRLCKVDGDCSSTREYCTLTKYCLAKRCGACLFNAQCANNNCRFFSCASSTCAASLAALQKKA